MPLLPHPHTPHVRPAAYDAWIQWAVPPVCNLQCVYCREVNHGTSSARTMKQRIIARTAAIFPGLRGLAKARHIGVGASLALYKTRCTTKPGNMPPIDIAALIRTLGKTGKTFRVGISGGGEPFLVPNIIEACVELSKKHFLAFNTNLTLPRCLELAQRVDPERVVHFHASLHLAELERLNLTDRFIGHFLEFAKRGFPIYAEAVGHPSLAPNVQRYQGLFGAKGITIEFGPFHGAWNGALYPQAYTDQELKLFGLDKEARGSFSFLGKPCNAGYNAAVATHDGTVQNCWEVANRIGHLYGKIVFSQEMILCPSQDCGCPLLAYDRYLWNTAMKETKKR